MAENLNGKKKIGFTCGAFDLTHAGHYLMFKECKENCDYLIVGLQTDPSIDRKDKNKPVQTLRERKIQLEACKYIDEIVTYHTEVGLYALLKKINPDVRFMGADWKDKPNYSRDQLPNMKVVYNSRDHDYSSRSLRERVAKKASLAKI
jgi:glycerol-3-phosphate cytidylyltransferase